jgi:hypothetical protein
MVLLQGAALCEYVRCTICPHSIRQKQAPVANPGASHFEKPSFFPVDRFYAREII